MKTCIKINNKDIMLNRNKLWADKQQRLLVRTGYQLQVNKNFVSLQDHMESPEAHLKNHILSQAQHIICTCWFHGGMQGASLLGEKKTFPLTCLSPLCRADAVLGAGDVLTSWWVLSVLLHSSFRFSSSLSLCFCNRRRAAEDGVPPRTFSIDGLRPMPSPSTPGNPVLAELRGSMLLFSPLLYSAQRFRMVSSRCLSFKTRHKKHCFLIFSLLLCLKHVARHLYIPRVWIQAAS